MRLEAGEFGFELRIAGYQFPGDHTSHYDSNWLIIEGAVRHPRGKWRFRDPCLLTYEVARLADWLEAVEGGTESEPWCGFLEPNLSFELVGEGMARVLRVSFAIEALPPWAGRGGEAFVEFPLAGLCLASCVNALRKQLKAFPQRAER
jgi:hypothetical protein